ncbi:MAG: hypothetical protein K1X72_23850 [Pyrinomonadaceae bacterium]|nr:hypothetical protein [Pyrinomonadaceae bacterium]
MNSYKPRKIELHHLETVNNWHIKVYSITFKNKFGADKVLANAIKNLPKWLEKTNLLGLETYKIAFLIVHEGRDGVWTLFNWWIGENMLQSVTFYTSFDDANEFEETPQKGGMACVWELEIIDFERNMWIKYILKKAENPDFAGYLNQQLNGEF